MIAAIYARKSTSQDHVAEDAKSVSRQVNGAKALSKRRAGRCTTRTFAPTMVLSGALFANRAEFQPMMTTVPG
jgi:hypothetical protein